MEDGFSGRVETLISRAGGIGPLADASGLSRSVIEKYRHGQSDPSRVRLLALAAAARVSLNWLAAGEGPLELAEGAGDSSAGSIPDPINTDRLKIVLVQMEKVRPTLMPASPEAWADLVVSAYRLGK